LTKTENAKTNAYLVLKTCTAYVARLSTSGRAVVQRRRHKLTAAAAAAAAVSAAAAAAAALCHTHTHPHPRTRHTVTPQ